MNKSQYFNVSFFGFFPTIRCLQMDGQLTLDSFQFMRSCCLGHGDSKVELAINYELIETSFSTNFHLLLNYCYLYHFLVGSQGDTFFGHAVSR